MIDSLIIYTIDYSLLLNIYICLSFIIFSRDKTHLNEIITENDVNILLQCANLVEDSLCILITTENTDSKFQKYLLKPELK